MSNSNSTNTTTDYTLSPRRSPRQPSARFRKSKTPPSRKSMFSPSSSDGDSSEDDFPRYRANWMEKSPSNSRVHSRRMYDDLKDLDELLSDAREIIRTILRK
jgi:hypothetical protein